MIVTLLTDFGLSDTYAGVMKGVILARAPSAHVVDLTHDVAPQAVEQAAFLFETAWRWFPDGTVHVVVVDPGVGTSRRRVVIQAEGQYFIGPDNGVLSAALPDAARGLRAAGDGYETRRIAVPSGVTAFAIENEALFLQPISATFEGRDVFAPVAAYLANGGSFGEVGPIVNDMVAFPAFRAPKVDSRIDGLVLQTDRFGNLITDIVAADVPDDAVFTVAGRRVAMTQSYAGSPGPIALVGSAGRIEIAMPNGSAALVLGAGVGDRVVTASRSVPG